MEDLVAMAQTSPGKGGSSAKPLSGAWARLPERLQEVLRFGAAGIASTLFYFAAIAALLAGTGLRPVLASALAYLLALGLSYLLQSRFAFRAATDSTAQVARFVVTAFVGLAFSSGAMFVVTAVLSWPGIAGAAIVCVLIPVANYLVFRSWVFAQRVETAAKESK